MNRLSKIKIARKHKSACNLRIKHTSLKFLVSGDGVANLLHLTNRKGPNFIYANYAVLMLLKCE